MTNEGIKDELYRMLSDINGGYPKRSDAQKDRYREAVKEAIEALEKTRWIPVRERLPEDGRYLVTTGDAIDRPMIAIRCFNKDLSMVDDYEFEDKKGISGWTEYDSEYGWYIDYKVIAWMPLPEPYRAESEAEE